jgi:hypothetical protein
MTEIKKFFSRIKESAAKFKEDYFDNQTLITDTITKLIITFGAVLIVGGLYLMLNNASALSPAQSSVATQTAVSAVSWVPGIPFSTADLSTSGIPIIGLVTWLVGIDLVIVGLGLWARHRFARLAALMIFVLAAAFQLIQFLYSGLVGSPASIVGVLVDGVFAYFLLSRFESRKVIPKLS